MKPLTATEYLQWVRLAAAESENRQVYIDSRDLKRAAATADKRQMAQLKQLEAWLGMRILAMLEIPEDF